MLALPYVSCGASQKEQSAGKESHGASPKKLDQNAELGKGHQDSHTKGGASEQEYRASQSGYGQNDPPSGRRQRGGEAVERQCKVTRL